jgi:hypothetical protein
MNRDLSDIGSDAIIASNITADIEGKALLITISSPVDGTFNIALRQFLKAEVEWERTAYRVFVDGSDNGVSFRELGREEIYQEFDSVEHVVRSALLVREPNTVNPITVDDMRVLSINFPSGNHIIEIRGTSIYYAPEVGHRHDTKDIFIDSPQYSCDILCDYNLQIGDETYLIAYGLYGDGNSVDVAGISADVESRTITVNLEATGFGTFHIFLPRSIIQSSQQGGEVSYLVKLDGKTVQPKEFDWQQIFSDDPFDARLLFIDFPKDAKRIEITGTWTIGEKSATEDAYFPCEILEKNCTYDLTVVDKTFHLDYAIRGDTASGDPLFPRIKDIYPDMLPKSLHVYLEAPNQGGTLTLDLPTDLISAGGDKQYYSLYQDFIVSGDHTNVIKPTSRIIEVKFEKGQEEIEIGGNYLYRSNDESLFSPIFPCSKDACTISAVGSSGPTYDLSYHLTGTIVTGFSDEVKVNSISIDSTKPSLLVDITANQAGRFNLTLDKEFIEKELAGDEGLNYIAYVEGRKATSNYTSFYVPDRHRNVVLDFEKGDRRIEVAGIPMQQYPCANPAELCLMHVQINGKTAPIVLGFSGGSVLGGQNAVSLEQILRSHAGHIHLPVPTNQQLLSINRLSISEGSRSLILDLTARRDGMLLLYPSKEVIQGSVTSVNVDGRSVEYTSHNYGESIGVAIPVLVDSRKVELFLASGSSTSPIAPTVTESQGLLAEEPVVSEPIGEDSFPTADSEIRIVAPQDPLDMVTQYSWWLIGSVGVALVIVAAMASRKNSLTARFLGQTRRILPAALGIEIICAASAETGSIIGILLFGFTTIGFITSFLLAYGVAGCTALVSIIGRIQSQRQSYSKTDERVSCGCDDVLAHGSDKGFISGLGMTFKYYKLGLQALPSLYKDPNFGSITKTSLFILITAESACIVTTATVDFFLYQYSLFLSIPLALVSGALVVALIAAFKSARKKSHLLEWKRDSIA